MMASKVKKRSSKEQLFVWLPMFILLGAAALAMAGFSQSKRAIAATTATDDVTVTATVGTEVHINDCANQNYGSTLTSATASTVIASCTWNFGTNNAATTAVLSIKNQRAGTPFFCVGSGHPCAGATDFPDEPSANTSLDEGAFGGEATAATNCTSAGWLVDGTGDDDVNPITTGGTNVCTQTAVGTDGSWTMDFRANPDNSNGPGNYEGTARATATVA